MEEKLVFILGDRLPTYYDAGIAIFNVCHDINSQKMTNCINAYVNALMTLWTKAFGDKHLLTY